MAISTLGGRGTPTGLSMGNAEELRLGDDPALTIMPRGNSNTKLRFYSQLLY
jgi:hypothetical protein